MSAYRFCRTDDIGLLVDALNRCWAPYFPDEPLMTPTAFKRSIRDLQVWCSSCMVAFAGSEPIGVLIGAKRSSATLIHKIAVHPDHRRQGHSRHLLASLGSKLAILGPPRIVAEVPETNTPASALFAASGYVQETRLTDYVLEDGRARSAFAEATADRRSLGGGRSPSAPHEENGTGEGFVIPITVDDLAANGLLEDPPPTCWERSVETLRARKEEIAGLALASEERIGAYVLRAGEEMVSLRSFGGDAGARLKHLLSQLRAKDVTTFRFPKVHTDEISGECLETLGFRAAATHRLYVGTARSE